MPEPAPSAKNCIESPTDSGQTAGVGGVSFPWKARLADSLLLCCLLLQVLPVPLDLEIFIVRKDRLVEGGLWNTGDG